MRKLAIIAMFTFGTAGLVGCSGYETGEYVQHGDFKVVGDIGAYDVLKDMDTGCLYLEAQTSHSPTPYYDEFGNVKGCGKEGD